MLCYDKTGQLFTQKKLSKKLFWMYYYDHKTITCFFQTTILKTLYLRASIKGITFEWSIFILEIFVIAPNVSDHAPTLSCIGQKFVTVQYGEYTVNQTELGVTWSTILDTSRAMHFYLPPQKGTGIVDLEFCHRIYQLCNLLCYLCFLNLPHFSWAVSKE